MADERAQDALTYLQAAALELIAAFRAVLDVAEEAVRDPEALWDVVTATAKAASQAAGAAGAAAAAGATADAAGAAGATGAPGEAGEAGGPAAAKGAHASQPVEHIRIS